MAAIEWTIADRLRKVREQAGLTQAELGAVLGRSKNTICQYETGGTEISATQLLQWAAETDCDPAWLLTGRVLSSDVREWPIGQSTITVEVVLLKWEAGRLVENPTGSDIRWHAGHGVLAQREESPAIDVARIDAYAPHIAKAWKGPYKYTFGGGEWDTVLREK